MRSNCIAVLLLMHAATGAAQDRPLPEVEPFIKEVRERMQTDRTLQTNYAYLETRRELKLDKGEVWLPATSVYEGRARLGLSPVSFRLRSNRRRCHCLDRR